MSNKAVPTIYRSIISSVIESVRSDFDEVGVEEAVLQELLRSWEEKVAHSRVADFSHDPRIGSEAAKFPPVPTQQAVNTAAALNVSHFGEVDGRNLEVKLTHVGYLDGQGASNGTKSKKDDGDNKAKAKKEADDGDEINSDLDDSEEEVDGEDDEAAAESGDLIIALYEKVQRTKNKWKVTLKDGLVSVGGKEYLFAKCQGEFEW
ncbi:transcription initiation factor TFIIA large subunit, partial [Phenoliferia sp. Uapishka_3]